MNKKNASSVDIIAHSVCNKFCLIKLAVNSHNTEHIKSLHENTASTFPKYVIFVDADRKYSDINENLEMLQVEK